MHLTRGHAKLICRQRLGRHPLVRAAKKALFLQLAKRLGRESKIGNERSVERVEQHVATGQIAVHNALQMNVKHSRHDSLPKLENLFPSHFFRSVVESLFQRPALHKVNHHTQWVLTHAPQLHHVLMWPQIHHQSCFLLKRGQVFSTELALRHFDGHVRQPPPSLVHDSKRSSSQLRPHLQVAVLNAPMARLLLLLLLLVLLRLSLLLVVIGLVLSLLLIVLRNLLRLLRLSAITLRLLLRRPSLRAVVVKRMLLLLLLLLLRLLRKSSKLLLSRSLVRHGPGRRLVSHHGRRVTGSGSGGKGRRWRHRSSLRHQVGVGWLLRLALRKPNGMQVRIAERERKSARRARQREGKKALPSFGSRFGRTKQRSCRGRVSVGVHFPPPRYVQKNRTNKQTSRCCSCEIVGVIPEAAHCAQQLRVLQNGL